MFRLRRLASIALEDFGLRRRQADEADVVDGVPEEAPAPDVVDAEPVEPVAEIVPLPSEPPAAALPPGVVWHGPARRRPELQRFCDHLARLREGVS